MVSSFREVVALWDSPDALASEVGASVFAARKWPQRDSIPADFWSALVRTERAREAGVTAELLADLASHESPEARA